MRTFSFSKLIGSIVFFMFLLTIAVVSLLPTFFSYDWTRQHLLGVINKMIPGTIHMESANVGWFSSQEIQNLEILDADGNPIVKIPRITIRASLFHLLAYHHDLQKAEIVSPWISLTQDAKGITNLHQALGYKGTTTPDAMQKAGFTVCAANRVFPVKKVDGIMIRLPARGDITITDGTFSLKYLDHDPFIFSRLNGHFLLPANLDKITAIVSGSSQHGPLIGQFKIETEIIGFNEAGEFALCRDTGRVISVKPGCSIKLMAKLDKLPVEALDRLIAMNTGKVTTFFKAALGDSLSATLEKVITPEKTEIDLQSQSPLSNVHLSLKTAANALVLKNEGRVDWTITPDWIAQLEGLSGIVLKSPTRLSLLLEQISIPLGVDPLNLTKISFKSRVNLEKTAIAIGAETYELEGLQGHLDSDNVQELVALRLNAQLHRGSEPMFFSAKSDLRRLLTEQRQIETEVEALQFPIAILDAIAKTDQQLVTALGKSIDFHMKSNIQSKLNQITLRLSSSRLQWIFPFTIDNHEEISIKENTLSYMLQPQVAALLAPSMPQIFQPTTIRLTVSPSLISLQNLSLSSLKLRGIIDIDSLAFRSKHSEDTVHKLHHIVGNWNLHAPNNFFSIDIKGLAGSYRNAPDGTLSLKASVQNWHNQTALTLDDAQIDFEAAIDDLPSSMAEIVIQNPLIPRLLGSTLNADVAGNYTSSSGGLYRVNLKSPSLALTTAVHIDPMGFLQQEEDTTFKWSIDPLQFDLLQKIYPVPLKLANTVTFSGKINDLHLQIPSTEEVNRGVIDFSKVALNGNFAFSPVTMLNTTTNASAILDDTTLQITSTGLTEKLFIKLKSQGTTKVGNDQKKSFVDIEGNLNHLFLPNGVFDLSNTIADLKIEFEKLPLLMISQATGIGLEYLDLLDPLVGSQADVKIAFSLAQKNGSFRAHFSGEHSRASVEGQIEQGVLTLNKPIQVDLDVTEKLSKRVLKQVNPLLITAVGSEKPITLKIAKEGFSIPLMPFDLSEIEIDGGVFDFGKVRLKNGGPLSLLLSFLQAKNLSGIPEMDVWFTPQYFSIENGIVKAERCDFLIANDFHIATWGVVDLVQDRVNITLGIDGDTIKRAFHLKNIPSNQWLQLKMKGSTANPKVDTTKAATQLTALIAQNQAGVAGNLIKGLFDVLKDSSHNIPRLTTDPLPWENDPEWKQRQQQQQEIIENQQLIPSANEQTDMQRGNEMPLQKLSEGLNKLFNR